MEDDQWPPTWLTKLITEDLAGPRWHPGIALIPFNHGRAPLWRFPPTLFITSTSPTNTSDTSLPTVAEQSQRQQSKNRTIFVFPAAALVTESFWST